MIRLLVLLSILSISNRLLAQAPEIEVKPGEIFKQVIPFQERYRYDSFRDGKVFFTNGRITPGRFNYNFYFGTMELISAKGDTLALANSYSIRNVTIGIDVYLYFYKQGYFEVVGEYASIKLSRRPQLRLKEIESNKITQSGYEPTGPTAKGISLLTSETDPTLTYNRLYDHPTAEKLTFINQSTFYIIDKNKRLYPATKSTILKLYPKHKKAIHTYLEENRVNFKQEEDLQKLLSFCSQLQAT